jgi:hypothetical protein
LPKTRWMMATALITLAAVATWQYSRMGAALGRRPLGRQELVQAALRIDVKEGGPGRAIHHLAQLAAGDPAINALGHVYAHQVGQDALVLHGWDPGIYAECTPRFQSGCYHGVVEAYVAHASLDRTDLSQLCERIAGKATAEVARRECAHGIGHGLWFRLHGRHREALAYCDGLTTAVAEEECRDGVFMQRAGGAMGHSHHPLSEGPESLACPGEPARYQHACWHYQGGVILTAAGQVTPRAFDECNAAGGFVPVCYWGIGKWIANRVRGLGGTDQDIIALCGQGQAAMLGACIAGAVENLVDENWTTGEADRLCRVSPTLVKAACYGKLGERVGILYPNPAEADRECDTAEAAYREACKRATSSGK